MKKFLLAFLIFISVAEMKTSFGQTYHPFPDTLAQWSETYFDNYFASGFGYLFALGNDTVIENKRYTLLGYNLAFSWGYTNVQYTFQIPGDIFGAIREDSTKKVWFRLFENIGSDFCASIVYLPFDSDIILYDFGMSLGDTAYWVLSSYFQVLQKIDSIQLLDGTWRREFLFDSAWVQNGRNWIEGIGSLFGLFGPYQYDPFEGGCSLSCFEEKDTLYYESLAFAQYDCNHLYTEISELELQNPLIGFPDPTNDFISFDLSNFPNKKFSITIYNSNGQQVNHTSNLHSSQLKIPVSQLGDDGLYFYTVSFDYQKIVAGKFLVQR